MTAVRERVARAWRATKIPDRDLVIAVVVAVLMPPANLAAGSHQAGYRRQDAIAVVLLVAMAITLAFRRRYTVPALALVFGLEAIYFARGYPNGPVWVPLVICYFTATAYGYRVAAATTAVAGIGLFTWLESRIGPAHGISLVGVLGLTAWLLVILVIGEAVRIRRERAATAARAQEVADRAQITQERLRIARELHDSLGHYLSVISVQSAVALNLNPDLPEQARTALVAVKDASREGLRELRSALDQLRADGEPAPLSPTLTLGKLDELIARTGAAGLTVRARTEGEVRPLPFGVDVAAYRIVQEALTNVTRHAGPASADVTVRYAPAEVTVQVDDDGHGAAAGGPASGQNGNGVGSGIAGMRERVAALGGELYAGPRPDGAGFRVWARLPLGGSA